jgi:hypothetical protein
MRRPGRRSIILVSCIIFAAAAAFIFWPGEREPEYQGKKLSEWIAVYNDQPTEFREAMQAMSKTAVPFLVKWIEADGLARGVKLNQILTSRFPPRISSLVLRWSRVNPLQRWEMCVRAQAAFQVLGPQAASAIPDLARIVRNSSSSISVDWATCSLAYLGKDALPPLLDILADRRQTEERRLAAANAIKYMSYLGSEAVPAVPILVRCLGETNKQIHAAICQALGAFALEVEMIGPGSGPQLPRVSHSTDPELRLRAVRGIGESGTYEQWALSVLSRAAEETDPHVRSEATNALMRVAPDVLRPNGYLRAWHQ